MNKDHYFDEEIEELTYERMEKALGEKIIAPMREELDKGWDEGKVKEKLESIYDSNYGIIERGLLLE